MSGRRKASRARISTEPRRSGQVGQRGLRRPGIRETSRRGVAFAGVPIDLPVDRGEPGRNGGSLGTQPLMRGTRLLEPPFGLAGGRARLLAGLGRRPIGAPRPPRVRSGR